MTADAPRAIALITSVHAYAAVEQHRPPSPDRLDDLRKRLYSRITVSITRPPWFETTMPSSAGIDCTLGVFTL